MWNKNNNPFYFVKKDGPIIDFPFKSDPLEVIEETEALINVLKGKLSMTNNKAKRELKKGDIVAFKRCKGIYEYFAVYIGNDRVIHFASHNGDDFGENVIHEAPFSHFLKEADSYYILDFQEFRGTPARTKVSTSSIVGDPNYQEYLFEEMVRNNNYHLYTPEETVERAQSRLGETGYHLSSNNCEHFAIWCKTGISESRQVDYLLKGYARYKRYKYVVFKWAFGITLIY